MSVGLVVVSHSARIAEGVVELAGQMARGVSIIAAGGRDDGGIGTSFELVNAAMERADSGEGVVVLCDLGSAYLTAETAVDFLDDERRGRVRVADAPIVEGTVAAAVAAGIGGSLEAVLAAARTAAPESAPTEAPTKPSAGAPIEAPTKPSPEPAAALPARAIVTLRNKEGLHARPAAEFVKLANSYDARVTVNGVDAKSLLRIMALGLVAGREATIEADGAQAREAVAGLAALVESGFGEE